MLLFRIFSSVIWLSVRIVAVLSDVCLFSIHSSAFNIAIYSAWLFVHLMLNLHLENFDVLAYFEYDYTWAYSFLWLTSNSKNLYRSLYIVSFHYPYIGFRGGLPVFNVRVPIELFIVFYVHMYVCMHALIYIYMLVYIYICIMYVCMYECMRVYMYYVYMYYVCMYACMYVCLHVYIYNVLHIIHIYIIHTPTNVSVRLCSPFDRTAPLTQHHCYPIFFPVLLYSICARFDRL